MEMTASGMETMFLGIGSILMFEVDSILIFDVDSTLTVVVFIWLDLLWSKMQNKRGMVQQMVQCCYC